MGYNTMNNIDIRKLENILSRLQRCINKACANLPAHNKQYNPQRDMQKKEIKGKLIQKIRGQYSILDLYVFFYNKKYYLYSTNGWYQNTFTEYKYENKFKTLKTCLISADFLKDSGYVY